MSTRWLPLIPVLVAACSGGVTTGSAGGDAAGGAGPGPSAGGNGSAAATPDGGGGSPPVVPSLCGNGQREANEPCDGDELGSASCADFGMTGQLGCTPSCELDPTACVGCGNGYLDPGELCDGEWVEAACLDGADPAWLEHLVADVGIEPGAEIDAIRGAPSCTNRCQLDFTTCGYCFDGVISAAEDCELTGLGPGDTADFGGLACEDYGFGPGPLGCLACGVLMSECSAPPPPPCLGGNCSLRFVAQQQAILPSPLGNLSASVLTLEYWVTFQNPYGGPGFGVGLFPSFWLGAFANANPVPDTLGWHGGIWGGGADFSGFYVGSTGVIAGAWHHVAGVLDPVAGTARFYLDGLQQGEVVNALQGNLSAEALAVGFATNSNTSVNIDEIRISSSVRYNDDFSPDVVFSVDADTLGLWHLDDNDAVLIDSGPLGLHGTNLELGGGQWSAEHP